MTRAAELLQSLGLSMNESRAYTALLGGQPATAYEIAKRSRIPSSKIYEAVSKLVARGILQSTVGDPGQSARYVALPPTDLVHQIRETQAAQTDELLPLLTSLEQPGATDFVWPLADESHIRSRANDMVSTSKDSVLVSLWPEELVWLKDSLRAAEERGVRIALVHFGTPRTEIGATYHHPVEKTLYLEKGGRGLTLVVDSQQVLITNFCDDGSVTGAWSRSQAFVTVAEDYIKHDVYITKVTRFLNDALTTRFGLEYERLRDIFNADA